MKNDYTKIQKETKTEKPIGFVFMIYMIGDIFIEGGGGENPGLNFFGITNSTVT